MSSTMVWSRAESVLDVVIFSLSVTGIGWRFDVRAEGGPVGSALAVHLRRSAALLPSTMSINDAFRKIDHAGGIPGRVVVLACQERGFINPELGNRTHTIRVIN